MKNKKLLTYRQCLDKLAIKYGYPSFDDVDLHASLPPKGKSIIDLMEEAAQKYAKQYKRRIEKVGNVTASQLIPVVTKYEKWLDGFKKKPLFTGKGARGLMLLDFAKTCQNYNLELLGEKTRVIK